MMRDQADAVGIAVGKTATFGGGASAVFFGMTANEIGTIGGLIGLCIGIAMQWFFTRRKDKRETAHYCRLARLDAEREQREREWHAARMQRLHDGDLRQH